MFSFLDMCVQIDLRGYFVNKYMKIETAHNLEYFQNVILVLTCLSSEEGPREKKKKKQLIEIIRQLTLSSDS